MRHIARERSQTDRSKPKRVSREPEHNSADRSGRKPVHRSLDHVIGVRIPASQPTKSHSINNLTIVPRNARSVREATCFGALASTSNPHGSTTYGGSGSHGFVLITR